MIAVACLLTRAVCDARFSGLFCRVMRVCVFRSAGGRAGGRARVFVCVLFVSEADWKAIMR